jgi:hypothetical protein
LAGFFPWESAGHRRRFDDTHQQGPFCIWPRLSFEESKAALLSAGGYRLGTKAPAAKGLFRSMRAFWTAAVVLPGHGHDPRAA